MRFPSADPKTSRNFVPAVYTADKQDTLQKIAKQQGIDLNALCQINGLNKNAALKPGQKIRLCEPETSQKSSASSLVGGKGCRAFVEETELFFPQHPAEEYEARPRRHVLRPMPAHRRLKGPRRPWPKRQPREAVCSRRRPKRNQPRNLDNFLFFSSAISVMTRHS